MNQKPILKQVVNAFGEIGKETVKEGVKEAGKIGENIISAKDLLGLSHVSEEEYEQKKRMDEAKKEQELAQIRQETIGSPGRKVEEEIKEVRSEKEEEEKKKEEEFLAQIRAQREAEARERESIMEETANPHKKKKKRGSALAKGKGKASVADMSATGEFKGKVD